MTMVALRQSVLEVARQLEGRGLTQGTSGNVSARLSDGFLVTPSAVPYAELSTADLVIVESSGSVRRGPRVRRPSSEWRMHSRILGTRPDVGAIVHAHPPWATALSCLRRDIPAFHYMVAVAGGSVIRCAEYATFGTQELADACVQALGTRDACLLANHGIVACGDTPEAALGLAVEVEALAGQYMRALSIGDPVLLDDAEMARVLVNFEDYRAGGRPK
jgi:L-fuculose-phosphate aldolase